MLPINIFSSWNVSSAQVSMTQEHGKLDLINHSQHFPNINIAVNSLCHYRHTGNQKNSEYTELNPLLRQELFQVELTFIRLYPCQFKTNHLTCLFTHILHARSVFTRLFHCSAVRCRFGSWALFLNHYCCESFRFFYKPDCILINDVTV